MEEGGKGGGRRGGGVGVFGFLGSRDYDLRDKPRKIFTEDVWLKIFKGGFYMDFYKNPSM